ncbi:hypothetical protein ACS7SF_09975 [Ralstonia sp. 25C]|uniref:hypothetical protein n=1 Tax=Ralstonia sp. 25C TaxID=3447363 RepID=UPI003F7512C7
MDDTAMVDMKAAALRRSNGQVVYFLFENTHEKNLYPDDPDWRCIAMGSYEQVLFRIFQSAALCEVGAFHEPGLLPETLIARGQRALRTPLTMRDVPVRVEPARPDAQDGAWGRYRADAAAVLDRHGRPDLKTLWTAGQSFTLGLVADLDVVQALHGPGGAIPPWHAVRLEQAQAPAAPELAPPKKAGRGALPEVVMWALDGYMRVGRIGAQPLGLLDAKYNAVRDFLCQHVYPLELRRTGVSAGLIRGFRQAYQAAPDLPDSVRLTIRCSGTVIARAQQWEVAHQIAAALGAAPGTDVTVTLGELRRVAALCDLWLLSAGQLQWDEASLPCRTQTGGALAAAA